MDVQQRTKLVRQRAAAKSSLTRIQTYICEGERKMNDIQARYENLPSIVNKFESSQTGWNSQMTSTTVRKENCLKSNITKLKQGL